MTDGEARELLDRDPRVKLYSFGHRFVIVLWTDPTLEGLPRSRCSSADTLTFSAEIKEDLSRSGRAALDRFRCRPALDAGPAVHAAVDLDAYVTHTTMVRVAPGPNRFPHACRCGSPAYVGFTTVECSRSGCPGLPP